MDGWLDGGGEKDDNRKLLSLSLHHLVSNTRQFDMYKHLLWLNPCLIPPLTLSLPFSLSLSLLFPVVCLLHLLLLLSLTPSRLIYVIPRIFSTLRTIHPLPISSLPTFFPRHVCDLRWSPPLIPLLLTSSAHGPVFSAAVQIQARTGHN